MRENVSDRIVGTLDQRLWLATYEKLKDLIDEDNFRSDYFFSIAWPYYKDLTFCNIIDRHLSNLNL